MATYLLGLDFGTGGAKACLIDDAGEVLAYSFREYPIITQKPGWSEHDARAYWTTAVILIRECLAKSKANPVEIRGIAVSSALPCLVMVDSSGEPIHNAYNLMDRRALREVEWLKELLGEKNIFDLTGNRLDDHPALVNLLWEKNNRPDSYAKILKALTIEGYINYKLTGQYSLVTTNAALYGVAYDIRKKRFVPEIMAKIGIREELIPPLHFPEEIIGTVSQAAAQETGLSTTVPVCAGQADFNASCIASGVIEEGQVQSNLGTCGNFGIIHKKPEFLFEMLALGFTVNAKDTFITIPTTTTGGMSLRFLRDNFSRSERISQEMTGIDAYDLLNQQAENVPSGSEGLIVLPFLMGERTPIWDAHARGCVFGLSLNHKKGHLVRATMEGVAYAMYDSFRIVQERGIAIKPPIVMHEGGAKSVLWRQIVTDVFNVPTVLTARRVGAPMGDAILAGVATGVFKDFSVSKQWAEYVDPIEPDAGRHELYMEYFQVYKSLYNHIREDFKSLTQLRERKP